MTAIPSFPSTCFAILVLGVFSIASGCKNQEEPRTASGEPIPFGNPATLPSDHPVIPADAGQGMRSTTPPGQSQTVRAFIFRTDKVDNHPIDTGLFCLFWGS